MRTKLLDFLHSRTFKLGLTYLSIIMIMSISFSIVSYHTGYNELGRQLPPRSFFINFGPDDSVPNFQNFFERRISEGRHDLLVRLILINFSVLLLGSVASYWLARRALEPIEASMEAQSQFVADASHELRTPLTAIKISSDVALRKPKLTLTEAKNIIEQNSADISKLQNLTEGLLKLARGEQAAKLAATSARTAAREAVNYVLPLAEIKNISINNKVGDIKVLANRQNLEQLIIILLNNALKYSPAFAVVTITSATQAKHGLITVSDQGGGIEPAALPHIFQRFYQAESSRTKSGDSGGYGLGLAIADKLIRENHGEITVSSQVGKGSAFTIKLPLAD